VKALLRVGHLFGMILMGFTIAFAAPIGVSVLMDDGQVLHFVQAAAINFTVGFVIWYLARPYVGELRSRDGFLLVAPMSMLMAASAALPLMLYEHHLSFTRAYFEAISGITATGATVFEGLDVLPPSIKLWRSELNWFAGLGALALATAVMPLLGVGGMQLHRGESGSPVSGGRLMRRLYQITRPVLSIYAALSVSCILALKLAGMGWLDAICHAFSTVSLGGFSTHDDNIAYFHSPVIEFVIGVFMLLAGINFATHYAAWRRRSPRAYFRDHESRTYIIVVLASCVLIAAYLALSGVYPDTLVALRRSAFNVISLATDCGFVSSDYDRWPIAATLWMLLLSCLCAASVSSGGGIKMVRTLVLLKQGAREVKGLLHPSMVQTLKLDGRPLSDRVVLSVLAYAHLYVLSIAFFTLLLLLGGLDPLSAFSAALAAINNTAHGLHAVGPGSTFANLGDYQLWVCTAAMLLGRLEIFLVVMPFLPSFWRE
jgi:trk system potassium uptake protein TrkH